VITQDVSLKAYRRDRETARKIAGVMVAPGHWAARTVHAFRRWIDDKTLVTWCGISVDLTNGGAQTMNLITCVQCPQASLAAFRGDA
jgi:hypothetical protein